MDALLFGMACSAALVLSSVLLLWLLSLRLRDASIIDVAYASLIAAVGVLCFLLADGHGPLQWLALGAIVAWGLRLTLYLGWRNLGKGEDPRYTKLRNRVADDRAFAWVSLRSVYLLQGAVVWLLTLPLQLIMAAPATPPGGFALAGLALWMVGFLFEAVSDWQLARFKADPANCGRILDTGLWRYTRHPNYFGNACVNWGIWLMACAVPWGWLTAIGPLAITHFLLNVTGKKLLERKMLKERPGYADYVARTSGFVPMPPRG
jgi:steroid 5-alpha reductase family enzyme